VDFRYNRLDTLNKEYASGNAAYPYVLLDEPDTEEISVASVEKLNRETGFVCYGFKIHLTKPLNGSIDEGFPVKCALSVSGVTVASLPMTARSWCLFYIRAPISAGR
jgi:hypothetical protein